MICFYCRYPLDFIGETMKPGCQCKASQTWLLTCRHCKASYEINVAALVPPPAPGYQVNAPLP